MDDHDDNGGGYDSAGSAGGGGGWSDGDGNEDGPMVNAERCFSDAEGYDDGHGEDGGESAFETESDSCSLGFSSSSEEEEEQENDNTVDNTAAGEDAGSAGSAGSGGSPGSPRFKKVPGDLVRHAGTEAPGKEPKQIITKKEFEDVCRFPEAVLIRDSRKLTHNPVTYQLETGRAMHELMGCAERRQPMEPAPKPLHEYPSRVIMGTQQPPRMVSSVMSRSHEAYKMPAQTDVCCFWCCHKFDWEPMGRPVKTNPERGIFMVRGCFCSLSCMMAYTPPLDRHTVTHMARRVYNVRENIRPAPPRETLAMFGGPYTIERFREIIKTGVNVQLVEPPLVVEVPKLYEYETKSFKGGATVMVPQGASGRTVRRGKDNPRTGVKNNIPTTSANPTRYYRVPREKVRRQERESQLARAMARGAADAAGQPGGSMSPPGPPGSGTAVGAGAGGSASGSASASTSASTSAVRQPPCLTRLGPPTRNSSSASIDNILGMGRPLGTGSRQPPVIIARPDAARPRPLKRPAGRPAPSVPVVHGPGGGSSSSSKRPRA